MSLARLGGRLETATRSVRHRFGIGWGSIESSRAMVSRRKSGRTGWVSRSLDAVLEASLGLTTSKRACFPTRGGPSGRTSSAPMSCAILPALLFIGVSVGPLGFGHEAFGQELSTQEGVASFAELEELDLGELLEIDIQVVSATKQSTSLNEAPSILTVVTRNDLKRWGYRTVAEALERILGFYVVDDHITPNVAVRGVAGGLRAESSIIKVMIDGHPVSYRPTSGNWLGAELVPMGAIEQIEVIRGPASALYGADAFMGVVNIITRSGSSVGGADFRVAGNLVNENPGFSVGAVGGDRRGDFEFLAAARYDQEDRSGLGLAASSPSPNLPRGAPSEASALGMASASGYINLTHHFSEQSFISLGGYFSLQDREAACADWAQLTATADVEGTRVHRFNSAVLTKTSLALSDEFTLNVEGTAFFGGDTGEGQIEVASPDFFVEQEQDFVGADVQLSGIWNLRRNLSFVIGSSFMVDVETLGRTSLVLRSDQSSPTEVNPGTEQTFVNPGLFGQANWVVVDRFLTLTGGIRYDYHNIYGSQVSGRFGAVSNPLAGVFVKALYGSAFKAPSPVLLYGRPAQSGDIIGNPDLEPQYVHTIEGQVIYQPIPALSVGTNLAYSYVQNLAVFSRSGFNSVARNVAELGTISWESYVELSLEDIVGGFVKYEMLLSERNLGDEGFQAALLGDEAGVFPDVQLRTGLWAEFSEAYLRGTLEVRYIGERRASDLNGLANNGVYTLEPYAVVDATLGSVGLELLGADRETVIEVIGRNLLDSNAAFPGEAGVDYPILPRTLLFQVRQSL